MHSQAWAWGLAFACIALHVVRGDESDACPHDDWKLNTMYKAVRGPVESLFADLDGDGLNDLLIAGEGDSLIFWQRNTGDGTFSSIINTITTAAHGVVAMLAHDLDKDGLLDVVSANAGDDSIVVFYNQGNGSFASQPESAATGLTNLHAIACADLDGDGYADIISARDGTGAVAWHRNDGTGHFPANSARAVSEATSTANVRNVALADLDGDGAMDIVAARLDTNVVMWYRNNGAGAFQANTISSNAVGVRALAAADMDQDGHVDVVSLNAGEDLIVWYRNDGTAKFPDTRRFIASSVPNLSAMAIAAMKDGDAPDVFYGRSTAHALTRVHNTGRLSDGPRQFSLRLPLRASVASVDALLVGDMDDDDLHDFLVVSKNENSVIWARGIGPSPIYTLGYSNDVSGVLGLAAGDLDGNGQPDLITCSASNNQLGWYEGLGSGTFSDTFRPLLSSAYGVNKVELLDLDKDGDLDVVFSALDANILGWLRNAGGGTFPDGPLVLGSMPGPSTFGVADMDNDGHIDIVGASETASFIAWYRNWGNATFDPRPKFVANNSAITYTLAMADLNGDGTVDVVAAHYGDDTVAWYRNVGGGRFSPLQNLVISGYNGATGVVAGDVNGDGLPDLVSISLNNYVASWFANLGDGIFAPESIIDTQVLGPRSLSLTDLDNDGDLDLVIVSTLDNIISFFINLGANQPHRQFASRLVLSSSLAQARALVVADISNDGHPDIVAAGQSQVFSFVFVTTLLSFGRDVYSDGRAQSITGLAPADIDGDGNMDVAWISEIQHSVGWSRNLGVGQFDERKVYLDTLLGAQNIEAGDMDGDGLTDILVTSYLLDGVYLYRNLGGGRFTGRLRISEAIDGAVALNLADLDQDGDLDILCFGHYAQTILWFPNIGNGTFSPPHRLVYSHGVRALRAVDLDGDGDLDVLIAAQGVNPVQVLRNQGQGVFEATTEGITSQLVYAQNAEAVDLDGDGLLDVVITAPADQILFWHRNLGNDSYDATRTEIANGNGFYALTVVDFDKDGDLDLITTSLVPGNVILFENIGGGAFAAPMQLYDGSAASTAAVDLTGNGFVDIIVPDYHRYGIRWLASP
ncbi:uncharacterized protein MONBRDRAFT_31515, partial [Monosiga brevicollis MX1]